MSRKSPAIFLTLLLLPAACATTTSSGGTATAWRAPEHDQVEAAFQQLQARVAAAGRVALDSDQDDVLAARLQERMGLLAEVAGDAKAVLAFAVPRWSVAALVAQADAYLATGQAILASPTPARLAADPEQGAAYRDAVEVQADVFRVEALALYRQATAAADEGAVADTSADRARAMAAELAPPAESAPVAP